MGKRLVSYWSFHPPYLLPPPFSLPPSPLFLPPFSLPPSLSNPFTTSPPSSFSHAGKIVLVVISLIGFIAFDIVYVGAVFNYAAQSEMNIYLLRAIRRLVIQKEYQEMDIAIKVDEGKRVIFYAMLVDSWLQTMLCNKGVSLSYVCMSLWCSAFEH